MALGTTLLHLKSAFVLLLIRFSAGMFRVCVRARTKAHGCDDERDAVLIAGFQRVSGAFAASSTEQLAAGLGNEDRMSCR